MFIKITSMALKLQRYIPQSLHKIGARFFSISRTNTKTFQQWYRDFWKNPRITPPYNHFTQIGDPILRSKAAPVPDDLINSPEVDQIIDHMVKVMRKFDCVGVAAPQIGISLRIIVMEFREALKDNFNKTVYEARKMSTLPLTVFVNPELNVTNYETHKFPEGCMSVRGYSAEVERFDSVTLRGIAKMGTPNEVKLSGWNARIAQHEMDHLNGNLYIDKMDVTTFSCTCWEAVNSKGGRIEIPFYK